ncbi:Glycosyl hydrolase family 10 [bacterium A37T11]|nr:Glycosyl hydrolase family 10 [bacterium A37T11]
MKPTYFMFLLLVTSTVVRSQTQSAGSTWNYESSKAVMSQEYWNIWNADVQAKINSNIYKYQNYTDQVKSLKAHGARIDIMGSQMHLFKPQQCLDISLGKEIETPKIVWEKMNMMSQAGVPIHLSEITLTAPTDDEKGRLIQSVIAYNLYRLWFSIENMMGITWWNIVDDCGAPGEPTTSGLFTRNMEAKPSYYALNRLINQEWTTSLTVLPDGKGPINFRGFKGKYRVTWKNKMGESKEMTFQLNKDGDGF